MTASELPLAGPGRSAAGGTPSGSTGRRLSAREQVLGALFLVPTIVLLGVFVAYPIGFTVVRSLFGRDDSEFVGFDNYQEMFDRRATRTAIENNVWWVVIAPVLVTFVGLVFAVLTERVRFGTAFKVVIFMPMAVSFLAAGVIFRFVYEQDPDIGVANALVTGVSDVFTDPGAYQGARPSGDQLTASGDAFQTARAVTAGSEVLLGIVGIRPEQLPDGVEDAAAPAAPSADAIAGTVWLDFSPDGGERGVIDAGERGMSGVEVHALDASGDVAASTETDAAGRFELSGLDPGQYRLRLPSSNFSAPWTGWLWLGDTDVTPIGPAVVTMSVIFAYLWIWAGFAMMVIAAGLAAIPRETQEAARVDGASEWQVFRKVTVPLLWPVLTVVVVTLVINVLKVFDLVLVIPPGSVQSDANVIALELWRVSFGGARDQGLGSALAVLLFALVVPFMLVNLRRFRLEQR